MNENTGPLAGGQFPAGWVSPDQHEAQQRQLLREVILREREQAARAELEAEVDRRLEAVRGQQGKPVQEPTASPASEPEPPSGHDGEHEPVSK